MSEFVWDENFEWIENLPLSNEEREQLTPEQRIQRELVLARYMAAYKGRWIIVKDQIIIASEATVEEIADRKELATADAMKRVLPQKISGTAFLAEAA